MMFSKIKISGKIIVKSGLHIGGGGETSMIGAIDSPVVRDSLTKLPIIPGSSLKGKFRYLLAKYIGFEVGQKTHNEDAEQVLRLFGASNSSESESKVILSRLQFMDAHVSEESRKNFLENDVNLTEVKFENTINRLSLIASPRQIERITRGMKFDFEIIYNVEEPSEIEEDFENIQLMLDLMRNDYLGGGGTRGNGRIDFEIDQIQTVIGEYNSSNLILK